MSTFSSSDDDDNLQYLSDSSSEDELFSFSNAGNLDADEDAPQFDDMAESSDDENEGKDLTSLQVEIYKNKHLKKRKRQDNESARDTESSKKKKRFTKDYYRKLIEDKQKEQEERKQKHRDLMERRHGSTSSGNEVSALEKEMRKADEELEALLKDAAKGDNISASATPSAPNLSMNTSVTGTDLFKSPSTDISKELQAARRVLQQSDVKDMYTRKRMEQIDQELDAQFMHERYKREAEESRRRALEQQKLLELRKKQQQAAAASAADSLTDIPGEEIKITVRMGPDEETEVTIGNQATSKQLLLLACQKLHFDPTKCTLEFDGAKLKGHENLSGDLDMEDDDLIEMRVPADARNYTPPAAAAAAGASSSAGKELTISFQYGRGDSLDDVKVHSQWTPKDMIEALTSKHSDVVAGKQITFYFDGCKIKESETLESLDIEDEDTIEMRLK